jgi:MFS family permease
MRSQFTGVLIIANYGVLLYADLGMSGYMPLLLAALWVTASFPGNIFTAFYVDKFGRRTFMLTGLTGLVVCLVFECALQALYQGTENVAGQREPANLHLAIITDDSFTGAAIFFIFFFIFFWQVQHSRNVVAVLTKTRSTFLDASQFVYLSEIFPTSIRSQGVGLGMIGMYFASIILLVAGPIALEEITWKFFLVLIIPTFFHLLNVYFFFPETKQRSLEDINAQ